MKLVKLPSTAFLPKSLSLWIELPSLLFPSVPCLWQGREDAGGDQVSSEPWGPTALPAAVEELELLGSEQCASRVT